MNLVIINFTRYSNTEENERSRHWRDAGLLELVAPYVDRALWANLPTPTTLSARQRLEVGRQLARTVATVAKAGTIPLIVDGEPDITSYGTITGLRSIGRKVGLVWFDARNPYRDSGDAVPCPVTALSGEYHDPLARGLGFNKPIDPQHMLLVGVHSNHIFDWPVTAWRSKDLAETGAEHLGREMSDWPPIYLHLDLSVLDHSIMPAVYHTEGDGMTPGTLITALDNIIASVNVAAIGITGYAPERDSHAQGLAVAMEVIEAIIRFVGI